MGDRTPGGRPPSSGAAPARSTPTGRVSTVVALAGEIRGGRRRYPPPELPEAGEAVAAAVGPAQRQRQRQLPEAEARGLHAGAVAAGAVERAHRAVPSGADPRGQ